MSAGHILVVDDEPSMLRYLQTVLELDSYRVTTASNGPGGGREGATAAIPIWCCWTW